MSSFLDERTLEILRASDGSEGLRTIGGIRFATPTHNYGSPGARRVTWAALAEQAGQPVGGWGASSMVVTAYLAMMEWAVGDLIPFDIMQRSTNTAPARLTDCTQNLFVSEADVQTLGSGGVYQRVLAMHSRLTIFVPAGHLHALVARYQSLGWAQVGGEGRVSGCETSAVDFVDYGVMLISMPDYGSEELRAQVVERLARCLNDADGRMAFIDRWAVGGSPGETITLDWILRRSPEDANRWLPGGQMRVALLSCGRDMEPPLIP